VLYESSTGRMKCGAKWATTLMVKQEWISDVRIFEWKNKVWNQLGDGIVGEATHDNSSYSVALSAL
jgi:hypothetical protein